MDVLTHPFATPNCPAHRAVSAWTLLQRLAPVVGYQWVSACETGQYYESVDGHVLPAVRLPRSVAVEALVVRASVALRVRGMALQDPALPLRRIHGLASSFPRTTRDDCLRVRPPLPIACVFVVPLVLHHLARSGHIKEGLKLRKQLLDIVNAATLQRFQRHGTI